MKATIAASIASRVSYFRQIQGVRYKSVAVAVLLLLCGGCQLTDMARFSYDNARSSYSWNTQAKETTVPFILIDNHIIVPVRINDSEPMNFVLDSGAGANLILESRNTRPLELPSSGQITVSGVGTGPHPIAHIIRDTTLTLGTLQMEGQSVIQLPLDSVPFFTETDDVYFDGVVGAPFFQRFTVTIDYDRQLVTFSELSTVVGGEISGKEWQAIPLQIEGGVPYLTAQVTNDQGTGVEVKLLVDTGARGSVSLTPASHAELHAPQLYFSRVDQGISGDVESRVTMLESLLLGSYQLDSLPVDYAMSGGESENSSNGILGNETLSRFNLIFDYANERILLKPNQRFAEPMFADRSGLLLRPHRLGSIVRHIAPDSGAASSSLQTGDIITSFDASPVTEITVGELKRVLSSEAPLVHLCWQSGTQAQCEDVVLADRFRRHETAEEG